MRAYLLVVLLVSAAYSFQTATFVVDCQKSIGPNTRFWQAIGHDFLYQLVNEPVGQELLDRMQTHNSCKFFRTHYTFSNSSSNDKRAGGSICGEVLTIDDKGNRIYNFDKVNSTYREYVKRGMKPIVEFDFFPDRMAGKFGADSNDEGFVGKQGEPKDWEAWQELLDKFMQNCVETFGVAEMRTWYFEVWNEPDSWDRNYLDVFFRLYDMFAATVKSYDSQFRVGGPACYHIYFMRDFLEHVVNGTNFVTGKKGSPIDFVSYHIYGMSGGWLDGEPRITPTVQRYTIELLWLKRLFDKFDLKDVEFHLNEWGQSSNFYRRTKDHPDLVFRDNERAALFMVKLVDNLWALEQSYGLRTDLLGYWGFCWDAKSDEMFLGRRELTTARNIPKPILTSYEILAKLGKNRLEVTGPRAGDRFGLLAARDKGEIQLLVYNFNETDEDLNRCDDVRIRLNSLSGKSIHVAEIVLDREHHNTFRLWQRMGAPKFVNEEIKSALLNEAELSINREFTVPVQGNGAELLLTLPRHSMRLLLVRES